MPSGPSQSSPALCSRFAEPCSWHPTATRAERLTPRRLLSSSSRYRVHPLRPCLGHSHDRSHSYPHSLHLRFCIRLGWCWAGRTKFSSRNSTSSSSSSTRNSPASTRTVRAPPLPPPFREQIGNAEVCSLPQLRIAVPSPYATVPLHPAATGATALTVVPCLVGHSVD